MNNKTIHKIRQKLIQLSPYMQSSDLNHYAAVAVIARPSEIDIHSFDILYIRRSTHPKDPWSGQLAMPGGRVDKEDESHLHAAHRECIEELGLNLDSSEYLGFLGEFKTQNTDLPYAMNVSAFLFYLKDKIDDDMLVLDEIEVSEVLWRPLSYLQDDSRYFNFSLNKKLFKAVDLDFNKSSLKILSDRHSMVKMKQLNIDDSLSYPEIFDNKLINEEHEILWGLTLNMIYRLIDVMNHQGDTNNVL